MIELDPTRFKTPPFAHQLEGIKALVRHPSFALFDEMGSGKSKQVIDAACTLAATGDITIVLVVVPAAVRCVWVDKEIGEIKKHSWVSSQVEEFHTKYRTVWQDELSNPRLYWIVTNYEFLRSKQRLKDLISVLFDRVMLVLDESSYIKNRSATQTEAIAELRSHCTRCVLLNGTPVTDSPLDLWAQMLVLDRNILGKKYKNYYHFRNSFAVMGGWNFKQVIKWKNLDKLSEIIAPYALRRLKKDCLDLPEKLYTHREVALTEESWKRYQELKKDFVMTLDSGDKLLEPNAAVRLMRLAQLTSGHLGHGVLTLDEGTYDITDLVTNFSSEKLDWCVEYLQECASHAIIVWCRWRRERERLVELLREKCNDICVYELYGGQSKNARQTAVNAFSTNNDQRRVLVAQPHAGGHGLNLIAATNVVYLSNDFSLGIRLQSEDRCHRPGQLAAVTYVDCLATGPRGQKSIDHMIVKALRLKEDLARWTTSRWRKELENDNETF
jgi:SNF2 family DNA or RNA helicase